MKPRG